MAEPYRVHHYQTEPCKVQYYWTEPSWCIIFAERTLDGSVFLCRTSLVQSFQRKNLLWFSVIGQNQVRFGITRQNPIDSGFFDGIYLMVQHSWKEPFWFRIFKQRTFYGSTFSVRTLQDLVLLYRTRNWFCTYCRTTSSSAKLLFFQSIEILCAH